MHAQAIDSEGVSMAGFRWLHVSDFHIGQNARPDTWDTARETLLDGIKQAVQLDGPIDLLVATGDLVFSGHSEQYKRFDDLREQLVDATGAKAFVAVPGNHDLERPKKSGAQTIALRAAANDPTARADVLEDTSLLSFVAEKFGSYGTWWEPHRRALPAATEGLLPGDFACSLDFGGVRVGILGLNSAAGHLQDAFEGDIWIDKLQVSRLLEPLGGATGWAQGHHLTLLLTHHPPAWLSTSSREDYTAEIYTRRRFSAHLFGHTHEGAADAEQSAGGTRRVTLQARSYLGLETFLTRNGRQKSRSHGFTICTCSLESGGALAHLAFREARRTQGEWKLHTDAQLGGDFTGLVKLTLDSNSLKVGGLANSTSAPSELALAATTLASAPDEIGRAIMNVVNHGDTDVLPFPEENLKIRDHAALFAQIVASERNKQDQLAARFPPSFLKTLLRTAHTRYRWVTQVDPVWNAIFLSDVLSIAPTIERRRVPLESQTVYSYRYVEAGAEPGDLFSRECSWVAFQKRCRELASDYEWVVRADIGNFYGSVAHGRLCETLEQQRVERGIIDRVRVFLAQFSNDGHGLPVGGPAARILSEAVLATIDQALDTAGAKYCRYSDDFALFAPTRALAEVAYQDFVAALGRTQGLVAQDLKTRVVKSAELVRAYESQFADDEGTQEFLKIRIKWDRYADPDKIEFERIRSAIEGFDIFGMITAELQKQRINEGLTRRLLTAVRLLGAEKLGPILRYLVAKLSLLTPVLSSVLQVIDSSLDRAEEGDRKSIVETLVQEMVSRESVLHRNEAVLAYSVRVVGKYPTEGLSVVLDKIFRESGELVQRDIVHAMEKGCGLRSDHAASTRAV